MGNDFQCAYRRSEINVVENTSLGFILCRMWVVAKIIIGLFILFT